MGEFCDLFFEASTMSTAFVPTDPTNWKRRMVKPRAPPAVDYRAPVRWLPISLHQERWGSFLVRELAHIWPFVAGFALTTSLFWSVGALGSKTASVGTIDSMTAQGAYARLLRDKLLDGPLRPEVRARIEEHQARERMAGGGGH